MRKLADIKGEEALDVLACIVDEVSTICVDKKFVSLAKGKNKIKIIQYLLSNYKHEILNVMAAIEGVDPKDFSPSIVEIPKMLLDMMNDPDLVMLFQSQDTVTSSGSATENIEEAEKE
jgi:hypothetical protein